MSKNGCAKIVYSSGVKRTKKEIKMLLSKGKTTKPLDFDSLIVVVVVVQIRILASFAVFFFPAYKSKAIARSPFLE